jgi:hypothetical protein
MIPCSFDESNCVLDNPGDMDHEECEALSVWKGRYDNGTPVVVSCWKLTKDEVETLMTTGRVWLHLIGHTMPPALLQVEHPFKHE